jgi:hypothetical protein
VLHNVYKYIKQRISFYWEKEIQNGKLLFTDFRIHPSHFFIKHHFHSAFVYFSSRQEVRALFINRIRDMLSFLKYNPFAVEALFESSLVLTKEKSVY